ncbi:MAG: ABC transporter permease [Acidobacteriota bacterium]|nr:ABC transporter permease [Acidobacteriota bacterium]
MSPQASSNPVKLRGHGFQPRVVPWMSWAFVAGVLAVWGGGSRLGWIDELMLPSPQRVGASLVELVASGEIWGHLAASLQRIAAGWALGFAAGLALGVLVGVSSLSRSVGLPLVAALFPIPKIALLPLFILWFGIGEASKVATIAFGVFFPTVVSTYAAVDSVPRSLIRMGQSFELGPRAIVAKILLPGALPGVLAGARISVSIALILVVAAEMIGAQKGVGALILTAGHLLQTDRLIAGVVILSLLGLVLGAALDRLERRLLRWR